MKNIFIAIIISFIATACGPGDDPALTAITNCPNGGAIGTSVENGDEIEFCADKDCFILFTAEGSGSLTYTYIFNPEGGGQTDYELNESMFRTRGANGNPLTTCSKRWDVPGPGTLTFIVKDANGREIGRMRITIKNK
jgi:hypothetical protein